MSLTSSNMAARMRDTERSTASYRKHSSTIFFFRRRVQNVTLATRYAIPAVFNAREYAEAGGLMTYGTSLREAYHQLGLYAGRVLKGQKPADLPATSTSLGGGLLRRSFRQQEDLVCYSLRRAS
jgi:ABC-type uncharacterized transport system substrate-binding protein